MRHTIFLIPLLLLFSCKHKQEANEAVPEVAVSTVTTDSVVLTKTYPGRLEAASKADVVGEVSGRLLSRNFTPGSYVQKGQLLFTIERTKYRDAVDEAAASLASAKSRAAYYEQQEAAMRKALESNAVSRMEYNQAKSNLEDARAQIHSAQAQLSTARTMLAKCSVTAPVSGYISESTIDVGNYVNGEASPMTLATIYGNSDLKAVFSIEESQYQTMLGDLDTPVGKKLYSAIPLKFSQNLPHSYTADLSYQAPSVSGSTGSITLEVKVKNIDNELKDGMFVSVSLPYGVNPKAMLVRDASISTDQLGKFVYVVNDSDKVVYTPIEVGQLYHDTLRVVTKGLRPGQRYVRDALLTVRNGMQVKPKK